MQKCVYKPISFDVAEGLSAEQCNLSHSTKKGYHFLTKCSICDAASDDVDSPFILLDWDHSDSR